MTNPDQSQFWDKYIYKTTFYNIKPDVARCYVRHAENYIKAQENPRLFEHTAIQMETYLREKGRNSRLEDWQYLFPSNKISTDPRTGISRRHHVHENGLQKYIKKAAELAGINKKVCVMRYAIPSLRICWKMATIFARCRNF